MRLVFFPAPDQLDWRARKLLGNRHRLRHIVLLATTPAKGAAQVGDVNLALFQRQARRLGQHRQRSFGVLARHPDLGFVSRDQGGAVVGLQGRVRQKRRAVQRLDFFGGTRNRFECIPFFASGVVTGGSQSFFEVRRNRGATGLGVGAFVPDDGQLRQSIFSAPPGVGHHRHGGRVHAHHAFHAAQAFDLAVVKAHHLAAKHRAVHEGGAQHAVQLHVHAIDLGAVELGGRVQALERFARHLPGPGVFEHNTFRVRHRQLGRCCSHLAVTGFATRCGVGDDAVSHRQLGHRHRPFVGRSLHEHDARHRATASHIVVRTANAATAARTHIAPGALALQVLTRRGRLGGHLAPVAFQLFGHQLGQAGARALPHLGADDADHAGVIGLDDDPHAHLIACGNGLSLSSRW